MERSVHLKKFLRNAKGASMRWLYHWVREANNVHSTRISRRV